MKTFTNWTLSLYAFLFISVSVFGQQATTDPATVKKIPTLKIDKSKVKVQRHTVMSRFEPEIASTEQERLKKRHERIADTEKKLSILDTLDISERKKRALLLDLKYTPFSNRLNKAIIVHAKFEETAENQDK